MLLFFQEKKGFVFESDTDTEVIAKLAKHVYDTYAHDGSFREVVEMVIHQLVSLIIWKNGFFRNREKHYIDVQGKVLQTPHGTTTAVAISK